MAKKKEKVDQIQQLNKRIIELENRLAHQEIRSLENQIKPHFLFNTLNLVARLILLERSSESLEVVYALSKLLRYTIEKKEMVRLRDEIQYVKNYLFIQKHRYDEKLDFHLDISQNILGCIVPALCIQPLVENAIKHGLEPKGGGTVRIIGRLKEDTVILTVMDDGKGFTNNYNENHSSISQEIKGSFGTGLKNIEKRIKYYFGEEYGIQVNSVPYKTEVSITIPLKLDSEDDYVPVFWF
ncbi:MAG: signal transduction histidine kinase, LytS [Peptococcaceae bacterium]|jgi:sensor histidine kinase YesM|nr:signal transduction histidine kinase, LytS [Peptococcaceae bacterium]